MALSGSQTQIMQQIIDYGRANGFTDLQIQIAVQTAFLESSLGTNTGTPPPSPGNLNPTASGLYQPESCLK